MPVTTGPERSSVSASSAALQHTKAAIHALCSISACAVSLGSMLWPLRLLEEKGVRFADAITLRKPS